MCGSTRTTAHEPRRHQVRWQSRARIGRRDPHACRCRPRGLRRARRRAADLRGDGALRDPRRVRGRTARDDGGGPDRRSLVVRGRKPRPLRRARAARGRPLRRRDRPAGGERVTAVAYPPVLPATARQALTFVRGEGATFVDADGRAYVDFLAGIAVVGLGHCHPAPLAAAQAQLERLWHASNLYWSEPMIALAEQLSDRFGGARAFFCNSGAEAVEAGLKYARKATGKPGVVSLTGSFHGRTLGALSVTAQSGKREAFEPLLPHVSFATPNDADSLAQAVSEETGCILLEPVQGEGGVHELDAGFVAETRRLADENGAVLLFDEVQTGVGRTGTFFAWERLGVRPDAVTLAKGLANGLPIGCLLVGDEAPEGFAPGDHASTFGGNPVACAAANAVCDELTDDLLPR